MSRLLVKPQGLTGLVHDITPQSAGWGYVGFQLWRLAPGETASGALDGREAILVFVEGRGRVTGAGRDWGEMGTRMDVFEKTPPHCLYLPNGTDWTAEATTPCTLAVCSAPGHGGHAPRRQVRLRGGLCSHSPKCASSCIKCHRNRQRGATPAADVHDGVLKPDQSGIWRENDPQPRLRSLVVPTSWPIRDDAKRAQGVRLATPLRSGLGGRRWR